MAVLESPHVCGHHSNYIPDTGCSKCPPVRIEITKVPNKIVYADGESIDITGIIVRAFKANGNLWGGFRHGIIPIAQLIATPDTASGTTITVSWSYQGNIMTDTYNITVK